ncbi:hypothetical protein Q0M94_00725 [Deinococcus radiomollis]|uniref:hypothetical protein n=1 Tax=Deinococcus radiomollis TaxID=468916 RepID=UPI0038929AC1
MSSCPARRSSVPWAEFWWGCGLDDLKAKQVRELLGSAWNEGPQQAQSGQVPGVGRGCCQRGWTAGHIP